VTEYQEGKKREGEIRARNPRSENYDEGAWGAKEAVRDSKGPSRKGGRRVALWNLGRPEKLQKGNGPTREEKRETESFTKSKRFSIKTFRKYLTSAGGGTNATIWPHVKSPKEKSL